MKIAKLISILLVIAAVGFSVPTVKSAITGEPLNYAFVALAPSFLVLAMVFFAVCQKSGGGPGPPSA